jgi:hypothetical protein
MANPQTPPTTASHSNASLTLNQLFVYSQNPTQIPAYHQHILLDVSLQVNHLPSSPRVDHRVLPIQ